MILRLDDRCQQQRKPSNKFLLSFRGASHPPPKIPRKSTTWLNQEKKKKRGEKKKWNTFFSYKKRKRVISFFFLPPLLFPLLFFFENDESMTDAISDGSEGRKRVSPSSVFHPRFSPPDLYLFPSLKKGKG